MRAIHQLKKAPLVGAFFVLVLWQTPASGSNCTAGDNTTLVKVRYVHDGDTLVLADDTRVRLIGINTPELGRKGKPSQPLAIRARDRLRQLLFQAGNQAQRLPGQHPQDRYKRQLAHLWLPDGRNLSAVLLRAGLGWQVAIPPNVRFADCYAKAETLARQSKKGVWKIAAYRPRPSTSMGLRNTGFQRVIGRITRINHGGGATWINLEGRFTIRIPDKTKPEFQHFPDSTWIDREIEVSGWVYQVRGKLRMNVGHPAMLQLDKR